MHSERDNRRKSGRRKERKEGEEDMLKQEARLAASIPSKRCRFIENHGVPNHIHKVFQS
jgi:hypothetical protein